MLVNLWWKSRFQVTMHFSRTSLYILLYIKASGHWKIESKRCSLQGFCILTLGQNLFMYQKWKFAEIHGQKQNSKLWVDWDFQFLVLSLSYSNNYANLKLIMLCYWEVTCLKTFKSWEYIGKKKYTKTPPVCLIPYIVCNLISFSYKSNIHTYAFQKEITSLVHLSQKPWKNHRQ